jgi:regulator of nonsense transcripts 1
MATELLAFPNRTFYDGALTTGPHAPDRGTVELVDVHDGQETLVGTSWVNEKEASTAAKMAKNVAKADVAGSAYTVVLLTPYAAQRCLLLSKGTGCEVHTIDSFQGREADVVILSTVRDGSTGLGFWSDPRRVTVALTRARRRLIAVTTRPNRWGPEDAAIVQWCRMASQMPQPAETNKKKAKTLNE